MNFYYRCQDCGNITEDNIEYTTCNECKSCKLKKIIYNPDNYEKYVRKTPLIQCPTCKSTDTIKISTTKRILSIGILGLASSNVGKTMECRNCGYKW